MDFSLKRALRAQAEGKALVAHPAFMDQRTPVSLYSPGRPREDALLSQRSAAHHAQAYGGAEAIDWVYDCINLYADPLSTSPYVLEKPDGTRLVRTRTEGTPPEHELGPQALYTLLDKPNPFMLYDELLSLLVIDLMLVGNHYWFKWNWGTPAAALYRLAPSYVKVKPGPYGPKKYLYQPPGIKDPLEIGVDKLVHFKRPNPHDPYYGMGVIQGAGRAMDLDIAITDTMASYYENKADPSMIVQSERRVPRDVFNKLRAQLRARASGSRRAGELLVLEAGLKASSLSTSASDALFDKLARMSRDRVMTKFRASPMLFGILDEASAGNKVSDVRREFDNYALRPFMDRVQRKVTDAICADFGVNLIIDYRQTLPAEDAIKVGESVAKIPGIKVREVRRQYTQFGIEESTGDKDIDNLVINVPGEQLDPTGQGGLADQPLTGEPGRPPLVKNTAAFGVANAQVKKPQGKALIEAIEARLTELGAGKAVTNTAGERVTIGNKLQGEERPADPFSRARATDVNAASSFIAAGLRDATRQLERDLLDHVEGKALKSSDLVSRIKKSAAWTTFKNRIESVLSEGARQAASSGVMHSGLTPEDDVDYDAIVKSVIHRPEGLRKIVSTLKERVANRIKEARDKNAERHEFEAAVRAVIAEWSDAQAVTVAETEVVHAYNEATLTAAEMSGVGDVYVTDGDEHDEPCKEADGSVWPIKHARENRLEHPRCRRAFIPLASPSVA